MTQYIIDWKDITLQDIKNYIGEDGYRFWDWATEYIELYGAGHERNIPSDKWFETNNIDMFGNL